MSERSPTSGGKTLLALLAGLLVFGLPLLLLLGKGVGGDRSSLDRGPEGSAAFAGVLRRMDLPVESLRVGLGPLRFQAPGSVLVMPVSPGLLSTAFLGPGELALLERFVQDGSTLLVVSDRFHSALEHFGIEVDPDLRPKKKASERLPEGDEARPVLLDPLIVGGSLAVDGRAGFVIQAGADVLFTSEGTPVAVRRSIGKGSVVAVSDPGTLSNAGIHRGGNLEFYVRLVEESLGDDGTVLFDDLHAGAGDDHGVVAYARRGGLLPTLLLLAFIVSLYLWRASCRFGTVLPALRDWHPRASVERVEATGGLYERAQLHAHALAVLSRSFRRRVERRSGVPWDRARLRAWLEVEFGKEASVDFERIRLRVGALLAQPRPDPASSLEVARLLHNFETRFLERRSSRD